MRHSTRIGSLGRPLITRQFAAKAVAQPSIASAHTPHGYLYYDDDILKDEWKKVLRSNWQYGGVMSKVSEPGDYISDELNHEPYIAVRSEIDNQLRVFYNVCRHHAAPILPRSEFGSEQCSKNKTNLMMADKEGRSSCMMKCPYHGWCYNTKGELTKAVGIQGIEDFKAGKRTTLLPIDCVYNFDHFMPLLSNLFFMIDLDHFSNNIDNHLDHHHSHPNRNHLGLSRLKVINDALIEYGFDCYQQSSDDDADSNIASIKKANELVHVSNKEYLIDCNWKVFVENYLDGGYHVPYLHNDLTSQLDMKSYSIDCYPGGVSLQCTKSAGSGCADQMSNEAITAAERVGTGAVYAFIYPNLMINRYGPWLDINYVTPIDSKRCKVRYDWWCERRLADDSHFVDESLKASELVQIEDMAVCENVFKGVCSTAYAKQRGRYAPKFETPMFQFHELYHSQMGLDF